MILQNESRISDVEDDVKRASWIREEIGDEKVLMMDEIKSGV